MCIDGKAIRIELKIYVENVDFQAYIFLFTVVYVKKPSVALCELANTDPSSGRRSCSWLLSSQHLYFKKSVHIRKSSLHIHVSLHVFMALLCMQNCLFSSNRK